MCARKKMGEPLVNMTFSVYLKDMRHPVEFHLPVRPYSPIDAHNRAAAAKGSPGYAQAPSYASYNGHHVTLSWND